MSTPMDHDGVVQEDERPAVVRTTSTGAKPRGILKHPSNDGQAPGKSLLWNEENLAVNELAKDSTMKITEPKTPYVRYNAETDQVMDLDKIPGFELGKAEDLPGSEPPSSPSRSNSNSGSNPNSRRGSEASEKMVKVEAPNASSGDESDDDELADEETIEHRKKFKAARGSHYKAEGEILKARAQALLDEEEDEASSGPDTVPPVPRLNGTA